jgi:hypothetical protein
VQAHRVPVNGRNESTNTTGIEPARGFIRSNDGTCKGHTSNFTSAGRSRAISPNFNMIRSTHLTELDFIAGERRHGGPVDGFGHRALVIGISTTPMLVPPPRVLSISQ